MGVTVLRWECPRCRISFCTPADYPIPVCSCTYFGRTMVLTEIIQGSFDCGNFKIYVEWSWE